MGTALSLLSSRRLLLAGTAVVVSAAWLRRKAIARAMFLRFIRSIVNIPPRSFAEMHSPPALDYSDAGSWAARPGMKSAAESCPCSCAPVPDSVRPAACFFVHPTGYFGGSSWNAPVPFPPADEQTALFLHGEASVYNRACSVYAPKYCQATFGSYVASRSSGCAALELAYTDVKRALLHFLAEEPERPIVLASHSQGGHHMMRLLAEVFEPSAALRTRLVACYCIGSKLPCDLFERSFPSLHPCEGPTDTGCVIAFDTLAENFRPHQDPFGEAPGTWYATGWEPLAFPTLNTNPLTWSSAVGPRISRGWLGTIIDADRPVLTLKELMSDAVSGIVSDGPLPPVGTRAATASGEEFYAESRDNCLRVPLLDPCGLGLWREVAKGGDYHILDYALFYHNIRRNVEERVAAFVAARHPAGI